MEELKKINNIKDNKINLGQKIILTNTKEKDKSKLHTDKNLNQDEHEDKNEVEQNLSELQNDISENSELNKNSTSNQTENANNQNQNQNDNETDNETDNEQVSKSKEGIYLKRDLDPNKKESKEKFFFSWPLQGRITSGYGKRHDPRRKYKIAFHKGIDIANSEGSPFIASKEGVVIRSKKMGGYGNCIFILHKENYITVYAHNKLNKVKQGDVVKSGETIGLVGRTGRVTGPHLHFELRHLKDPMNPLKLLGKLNSIKQKVKVLVLNSK